MGINNTYIISGPAEIDETRKSSIQLEMAEIFKLNEQIPQNTTHINVVAANQPQREDHLEQDGQRKQEQPRQQEAARVDLDAVHDQRRRHNQQAKVQYEEAADHPHRQPDVRLEQRRVELRRVASQ